MQTTTRLEECRNTLYDSHIHLTDLEYTPYMNNILANMDATNTTACCVSMNTTDSKDTLALALKSKRVMPFVGIHPEHAQEDPDDILDIIKTNVDKISGIGEIGLDTTLAGVDGMKRQQDLFEALLDAAEQYKKPVSIHSRKTLDDVLETLKSYSTVTACLHWFDGGKKQLRQAMDMGLYVSYGPVMVYAEDKRVLLSHTHKDLILVETDGPVKFSRCFNFLHAQINFIPSVVFSAAKSLKTTYDEMAHTLCNNTERFLGI